MSKDISAKKWKWEDEYLISSYEVDARGRMPLPSLCKFMQETAYRNADHLGFGYTRLKEDNLFWVLARLLIRVDRYPAWNERIRLQTWPSGMDRLMAFRDFRILDESGTEIGAAGSAWLMLDAVRQRPQRPTEFKPLADNSHLIPTERSLDRRPDKVAPLTEPEEGSFFPVRYSDLDLYDHVNNARYIQWIMDDYSGEIHKRYEVAEFEINFLSQARLGDEAAVHTQKEENDVTVFRHGIKRKADSCDFCLAAAKWREL